MPIYVDKKGCLCIREFNSLKNKNNYLQKDLKMKIKDIAKACHEANKALCDGIGDDSQKHWDDSEDWQKESAINGVKYFINYPDAPDSAQHNAWVCDKLKDGWRYGEVKNAVEKTHPCIVRFEELPLEQQAKDTLFKAVCRALTPLLDKTL